uniref:Uncharacterized protein n=1 Tax=Trichuris muris TaxID=70415 RepID=A0A5S6R5U6_TRIMR
MLVRSRLNAGAPEGPAKSYCADDEAALVAATIRRTTQRLPSSKVRLISTVGKIEIVKYSTWDRPSAPDGARARSGRRQRPTSLNQKPPARSRLEPVAKLVRARPAYVWVTCSSCPCQQKSPYDFASRLPSFTTRRMSGVDLTAPSASWTTCPNGRPCPGYKDSREESFCCKSKVQPGDFFCCDYATKANSEYKGLLKEHLAELVGGLLGAAVLLLVVVLAICFYCKCCALYKKRKHHRSSESIAPFGYGTDRIGDYVWSSALRQQQHQQLRRYSSQEEESLQRAQTERKQCTTPPPPYSAVCQSFLSSTRYGMRPSGGDHPPPADV